MIAYIETNFILELAYRQEQKPACEEILRLCAEKQFDRRLRIPSVSLCEPYSNIQKRFEGSAEELKAIVGRLKQFKRPATQQSEIASRLSQELLELFVFEKERDRWSLQGALVRTSRVAEIIQVTPEIVEKSIELQAPTIGLTPIDSMVISSIISDFAHHQSSHEKLFVTRDKRILKNEQVRDLFKTANCLVLDDFSIAADTIRRWL